MQPSRLARGSRSGGEEARADRTLSTRGLRTVADAMLRQPKLRDQATTVAELRAIFRDDHIHAVLIAAGEVLISVIDRLDVQPALPDTSCSAHLGKLHDRVIGPGEPLDDVQLRMISTGRRRLAVIDEDGRLLGLLCLKRSLAGFCSDREVAVRAPDAPPVEPSAGRTC